jgi:glutamyl-Q tRNA(Asp) synthetase
VLVRDELRGERSFDVAAEVGDFLIRRRDGAFAYQLAVVVDDAAQGITDIVRGADLLDSTARQIHLQRLLGVQTPTYLHVPVVSNAAGEKLSKQTGAPAASAADVPRALAFLGHEPPGGLDLRATLDWATMHWNPARIPRARSLPHPPGA